MSFVIEPSDHIKTYRRAVHQTASKQLIFSGVILLVSLLLGTLIAVSDPTNPVAYVLMGGFNSGLCLFPYS